MKNKLNNYKKIDPKLKHKITQTKKEKLTSEQKDELIDLYEAMFDNFFTEDSNKSTNKPNNKKRYK